MLLQCLFDTLMWRKTLTAAAGFNVLKPTIEIRCFQVNTIHNSVVAYLIIGVQCTLYCLYSPFYAIIISTFQRMSECIFLQLATRAALRLVSACPTVCVGRNVLSYITGRTEPDSRYPEGYVSSIY